MSLTYSLRSYTTRRQEHHAPNDTQQVHDHYAPNEEGW
jgi:hypothetical protein